MVEQAGAGLTARPEDAEALAHAVCRLAAMPDEERAAMGERGHAYVSGSFQRESLADRLGDLLRSVTPAVAATSRLVEG
jgi:glycosyltransferase involved in cell wall biosynthesis